MKLNNIALDLHLFDEAGAAAGDGSAAPANTDAAAAEAAKATAGGGDEPNAQNAEDEQKARREAFEARIKGDDKDLFDERVQGILAERFKGVKKQEEQLKTLQAQNEKQQAIMELLGSRYQGVDVKDADALMAALEKDDSMWERYAEDMGVPVDVAKRLAKAEREAAVYRQRMAEDQRRQNADRTYAKWEAEAAECKKVYAGFDLTAESRHPQTGEAFVNMLKSGVPVKLAYQTLHMDEIISGVIQTTKQTTQKKTVDDIRARGMRPDENGLASGKAATVKLDVNKMTNEQIAELHRRALAGEVVNPFSGG